MEEEKVFFDCGDIRLEGVLNPAKAHTHAVGVVMCHPHPQYGGDMQNSLVVGITRILSDQGFTTLRFNFRGVGHSEGSHCGGVEEVKDVESAIDFLEGVTRMGMDGIFLVGYSFGAMVGLQVGVGDDRVGGWVGISPPIAMYDFEYLTKSRKPKLLLYGDSDFVCPGERMEELFESLEAPKSRHVIPGTDHFFLGKEKIVAEHVKDFLATFKQ